MKVHMNEIRDFIGHKNTFLNMYAFDLAFQGFCLKLESIVNFKIHSKFVVTYIRRQVHTFGPEACHKHVKANVCTYVVYNILFLSFYQTIFRKEIKQPKNVRFDPQKWKPVDPFRWVKFSKNLQQIHL
jgi:hypothetical protein